MHRIRREKREKETLADTDRVYSVCIIVTRLYSVSDH